MFQKKHLYRVKGYESNNKIVSSIQKLIKPSELMSITGACLFVAGGLGYASGNLPQNLTPVITATALIFIFCGTIMNSLNNKRRIKI